MEIIAKHTWPHRMRRAQRKSIIIFAAGFFIIAALLAYSLIDVIKEPSSFISLIIVFLIFILYIVFIRVLFKNMNNIQAKQSQGAYRFDEFEFNENEIRIREYSYYLGWDIVLKYGNVKKAVFTKNAVYFFIAGMILYFCRADMDEQQETQLIGILKEKLTGKVFNGKIPKKDLNGCTEKILTAEKEVVNQFPEIYGCYSPSSADIKFASVHNYVNGKKANRALAVGIWITAAAISFAGMLLMALFDEPAFESLFALILFISLIGLGLICIIFSFSSIGMRNSKKITETKINITDYFITFESAHLNGNIFKASYNFASLKGITEFYDYFVFVTPVGSVAVPKSAFTEYDIMRQIFQKELGNKYRYFPTK